jgi:hypothetical protein
VRAHQARARTKRGNSGRIVGTGCIRENGLVSKTVAVEFRGRAFWAFDVSLSILLRETVVLGARTTDGDWLDPVLAELRHAAIGGSTRGLDLDLGVTDEQRQVVVRLIEQAGERLSQREFITAPEAAQLEIEPGVTVRWRPADAIPTEPILDLSRLSRRSSEGPCPTRPPATGGASGRTVIGRSSACATTRAGSRTKPSTRQVRARLAA